MVATLDPAARPHRQRRAAHPADRAALGDRRRATSRCSGAGPRTLTRVAEPRDRERLDGARRRAGGGGRRRRPDRGRLAQRRARGPGRRGLLRRGAGAVRACWPASCGCLRAARRRAAARPGPPDHRHHRHRRRAGLVGQPGGAGPARQPRPVRARRSRSSRPSTATVTLAALLAYLEAEDELRPRASTWRRPTEADSVKLLTVHRAKGLEWDAVFLVGVARAQVPHRPSPHRAG